MLLENFLSNFPMQPSVEAPNNLRNNQTSRKKKSKIQDRLKLLSWKITNNIIPTKSLIERVVPLTEEKACCPIYKGEEESQNHLFLSYPFTRILWRHSPWPLNLSYFENQEI